MNRRAENKYFLYVLRLEQNKYYIGITSKTPKERFKQHVNGFAGAEWTKIYKPLAIEQSKYLGLCSYEKAEGYENKVTREYIKKYGLDNVRGGNITYRGKLVQHFGYAWRIDDWKDITFIVFILICVIFMTSYIIWDTVARHGGIFSGLH